MPKQNQILAIEKQAKAESAKHLQHMTHVLKSGGELLTGISRTYRPVDEDGEKFPPEQKRVQLRVKQATDAAQENWRQLWDLTATKDLANLGARADVVVNGQVLIERAPATFLIWLEKQLVELMTFVESLPILPQSENWTWDENQGCYRTDAVETAKTKKVPKPFVKYEATKEHPAQVEVVHEDVLQGYWTTTKFSGALPKPKVEAMRARVSELQRAVKFAREQANMVDAEPVDMAKKLLDHVFAE